MLVVLLILAGSLNYSSRAQLGGLMNKVKNKIVDKALGKEAGSIESQNSAVGREPSCASDNARVVFEFEKGYKVAMNEITVCIREGDLLLFSKIENKYFIKKKNSDSTEGPFEANDKEVIGFECRGSQERGDQELAALYPEFISRAGEKYQITFGGKTYGPYAVIQSFVVSSLKTKFAAQVIPELMMTENEGAQMEKEANEAVTMEQKMELARKVQERMMNKTAGTQSGDFGLKTISNVEGVDDTHGLMAILSSSIKYDEIVWVGADKIMDLGGNTIFTFNQQHMDPASGFWLSSDNSRYVSYNNGILKFSDGQECSEVFAPYLYKEDGRVVLNYHYFSPKNNAIMQLSVPF